MFNGLRWDVVVNGLRWDVVVNGLRWDVVVNGLRWDVVDRFVHRMKKQKCHTVGTILKSNIKIVERDKINTLKIQIHDRSHSCHN